MKSCVGFGHRDYGYKEEAQDIERIFIDLIEKHGVTQFYFGGRGDFDYVCSNIVRRLKVKYACVRNTLFLSYIPVEKEKFYLPPQYDDTEYVLQKFVPSRFAILQTNIAVIDKCDFVLSGVRWHFGGANKAIEYAEKKKKTIICLFEDLHR